MNIEKVKEIKKALENNIKEHFLFINENKWKYLRYADILTYINELESDYNELKEIVLNEAIIDKKVGEMVLQNLQLKAQIAELEEYIKGNAQDAKAFVNGWHKDLETELKQFAERLKGKAIRRQEFIGEFLIDDVEYVKVKDIDEALKEVLKNG